MPNQQECLEQAFDCEKSASSATSHKGRELYVYMAGAWRRAAGNAVSLPKLPSLKSPSGWFGG